MVWGCRWEGVGGVGGRVWMGVGVCMGVLVWVGVGVGMGV